MRSYGRCWGWVVRIGFAICFSQAQGNSIEPSEAQAMVRGWLSMSPNRLTSRFSAIADSVHSFPGFHVIQLEPEGYLVTSNDDELEPVVAFSATGRFDPHPENPLWILLNQDLPSRLAGLREFRTRRARLAGVNPAADSPVDAAVLQRASRNRSKWEQLLHAGEDAGTPQSSPTRTRSLASGPEPPPPPGNPPAQPVRILGARIVDKRIQLTHDSSASVSILTSHDAGVTWQPADVGVVHPEWTSKRPATESGGWFRVIEDGVFDAVEVAEMRHPSPVQTQAWQPSPSQIVEPDGEPIAGASRVTLSDLRIPPIVQSRWSQSTARGANCYNYYTPNNHVCGCVATALAQVLRYWQYPASGIGRVSRTISVNSVPRTATTRGADGNGGAYTWSSMPLIPESVSFNALQWQMIGSLCYDAGVSVSMMYSASGSGAYMSSCATALTGVFKFASAKYVINPPDRLISINSNLAAGYPVMLGISSSGRNGHAVICDGFGYDAGTLYHHINMGWAGASDAWYTLPLLDTSYGFNTIDTVIYNAFPTGAGELITGRITTVQGVPVQGATITASGGGQSYSDSSDAKGYYGIKVASARTYDVSVAKAGMNSASTAGVAVGTSSTSGCANAPDVDFSLSSFSFTATAVQDTVWLRWTVPTNCSLPNNTVYIRHRTDRHPTSATDGTEVYTGNSQVHIHPGRDTSGTVTNYYAIWGNDGTAYATLAGINQAAACADTGSAKLFWAHPTSTRALSWLLKPDGARRSASTVGDLPSGWRLAGTGDVDRDGVTDLIWHNASLNRATCWLLNADGTKRSGVAIGEVASGWAVAGAGDIDADGTTDLVWHNASLGKLNYWLIAQDGTKRSGGVIGDIPSGWVSAGMGDFDGDGTSDLVWYQPSGGRTRCWLLRSDGSKRVAVDMGNFVIGWKPVGIGDIDRDGVPDLVWYSAAQSRATCWFINANATRRSTSSIGTAAAGWALAATGDVDGDGTLDLLWHNASSNAAICWRLNPDGTRRASTATGTAATGWSPSRLVAN